MEKAIDTDLTFDEKEIEEAIARSIQVNSTRIIFNV